MQSHHDLISLFEHDLFGKPVSTFPDHAPDAQMREVAPSPTGSPRLTAKAAPERITRFFAAK
jgi:hypothetical protein